MGSARPVVAIILAGALAAAVVLLCVAVVAEALVGDRPLSDAAAQLLGALVGAVIGILGTIVGYRAAHRDTEDPVR